MNRVLWHGTIRIGQYALLVFLWWGRGAWRWPSVARLCKRGQGYSHSEWRYRMGLCDGKFRIGTPERTQL
jgi:hypothetical protein